MVPLTLVFFNIEADGSKWQKSFWNNNEAKETRTATGACSDLPGQDCSLRDVENVFPLSNSGRAVELYDCV